MGCSLYLGIIYETAEEVAFSGLVRFSLLIHALVIYKFLTFHP